MDLAPEVLSDPETGKLGIFGPGHGFWVPPHVELVALPPPSTTVVLLDLRAVCSANIGRAVRRDN